MAVVEGQTIRAHVESLLTSSSPQDTDEFWTLAVLEERAVGVLVEALLDPRFQTSEARGYEGPFDSLLRLLEALAPDEAVPALEKLLRHPNNELQRSAARLLGSIGKPSCEVPLRTTIGSDDHWLREYAVDGLLHAHRLGRLSPRLAASLFDDVAAVLEMESLGGTRAPEALITFDRERGAGFLLAPQRFRAGHPEIASITKALADARVVVPVQAVLRLLDDLEREPPVNPMKLGPAIQLLALTGHASAAQRIEQTMASAGRDNDYIRSLAANAYLILHGVPDAYHVAISAWSAEEVASLPEPIRHYATAHVLLNEVRNGSLGQYFDNSYGEDVHYAIAGLDAIGAKHAAALVRKAVALFGKDGPSRDRKRRQAQVDALDGKQIVKLSDELLDNRDQVEVLLARFVVRHTSYFVRK